MSHSLASAANRTATARSSSARILRYPQLLRLRSLGPKRAEAAQSAAAAKIHDIDEKLRDLKAMRGALAALLDSCRRAGGPIRCPILEALEKAPPGA